MKGLYLIVAVLFSSLPVFAQQPQQPTLTASLVRQFTRAWDENDPDRIASLIQPDAFFKSPYQLRYGRDTMKATVLTENPPVFHNTTTVETFSKVKNDIAWSIGTLTAHIYDREGNDTGKLLNADYVYVFTKNDDGDWKLQMMIFHEE